jgi:hypothetical protein
MIDVEEMQNERKVSYSIYLNSVDILYVYTESAIDFKDLIDIKYIRHRINYNIKDPIEDLLKPILNNM